MLLITLTLLSLGPSTLLADANVAKNATTAQEKKRLEALKSEYDAIAKADNGVSRNGKDLNLGRVILNTVVVLGLICALAYLLLGKLLPKLLKHQAVPSSRRIIRLVDRLPIDQRRSILIVRIEDQHFLLGSAEGNISLLSELDAATIERAIQSSSNEASKLDRVRDVFARKSKDT